MLLADSEDFDMVAHLNRDFEPPSSLSGWRWAEENITMDNTGPMPGRYSTELTPMVRWFDEACDTPGVERNTGQISAQSAKTQTMINRLVRTISENPGPAMWVGATKDNVEEFAQKRLFPAVESCPKTAPLVPKDKKRRSKKLIQFASMNLMLRGTESRIGLQSDPVRYIFCDERREWKKGAINLLRKRTRTFYNAIEISIGTAGDENDELDSDFKAGSQTHAHFKCLKCYHSQPFRFGRGESPYHRLDRKQGGLIWEDSPNTRPDGNWGNFDAVRATVRYECEGCGHQCKNSEKINLIRTLHPVDYNPDAPSKFKSFHWNALAMPWPSCSWENIVEEFLRAEEQVKFGNLEPLKAFVTETLGEPWQTRAKKVQAKDFTDRIGKYKLGQFWCNPTDPAQLEPKTVLILTFDRQHLGRLPWVLRQWRGAGQSRLIDCGEKPSLDDLRAMQLDLKIKNRCVFGDDHGPNVSTFRQCCLRWGWIPLFGEDSPYFHIQSGKEGVKSYRQGWKETSLDPGIGTTSQGVAKIAAYMWSNPHYKDRLYHFFARGLGPLWEVPEDSPANYMQQINANEFVPKDGKKNKEDHFQETGVCDFADCELMQLVAADLGQLTRSFSKPTTEENKTS